MRRFVVALGLLALLASDVGAVSKTIQWDPVTMCMDGTACTVSSYTLYRSVNGGTTFTVFQRVPGSGVPLSVTDSNMPDGNICYQATASNIAGEGPVSNRLCFQVSTVLPKPPTLRAN